MRLPDCVTALYVLLVKVLFATYVLQVTVAVAMPEYAAVDEGVLVPFGMTPRFFLPPIDGQPGIPDRSVFGKRQDTVNCAAGSHSCYGVGNVGATLCCPDDRYCYTTTNGTLRCCAIGNTCDDNPCLSQGSEWYACNATKTITVVITESNKPTTSVSTSSSLGCCNHVCALSEQQCLPQFGDQCCPNTATCITGGCAHPQSADPTTVASPIPSGCTATTQIACPTDQGGGCCDIGQTCITSNMCSPAAGGPTAADGSTLVPVSGGNDGLSQQAKAGIGAGVAIAAALIIGGVTWFWIYRRRQEASRRSRTTSYAGGAGGVDGMDGAGNYQGVHGGGIDDDERNYREREMSDVSGPTSGGFSRPALHSSGLVYDYFGPDAVTGPYTTTDDVTTPPGRARRGSSFATAPDAIEPGTGTIGPDGQFHLFPTPSAMGVHVHGADRGVPLQPEGPGDITAPVEIDSSRMEKTENVAVPPESKDGGGLVAGGAAAAVPAQQQHQVHQGTMDFGPFELPGSPGVEEEGKRHFAEPDAVSSRGVAPEPPKSKEDVVKESDDNRK